MTDQATDEALRRTRMVEEQLVRRGLRDEDVLAAMRSVPRHLFVPGELGHESYMDTPLPIGLGQTISQPYMVALMTSLLEVTVRSRVLEVGAGSGYQTAVLAEVAGEVYAVERLAPLAERARVTLAHLGYRNARVAIGDGALGWPEEAPFAAILVAAAAQEAPRPLLEQLEDGGRLVIPLGRPARDQVLTVVRREGDTFLERHDTRCRFVPLVSDARPAGETPGGERARGGGSEAPTPARSGGGEGAAVKAVEVHVSGRVQGVYYRASARLEAERLGLRGWVRNLSDGGVGLRLQGDPAVVDAMLDWCRHGPPAARVSRVEVSDAVPNESLSTFEVR